MPDHRRIYRKKPLAVFEAGSGITRRLGPSPTRSAFLRSASCPRYACFMAREQETRDLADDDLEELLEAAAADEREGHLHHCATEQELREFLQGLRREPS